MEAFKIHILGCGSALPTARHNTTSQVVELRGKLFMIDCGEGTQSLLRRSKICFSKISHVFISHLHGDHCFGLIGMISTFGLLGRTAPLHIYAPKDYEQLFQMQMEMFCQTLDYEVVFHPLDTDTDTVIYDDRSLSIQTLRLNHRIPCCGFLFREKPTLPHIRRDMIDFYNIPVCEINNIKAGKDWTTADGDIIPNERLVTPANPPRSYAYCSDTAYMPSLAERVKDVNVLYHESTYGSDNQKNAAKYYHSTAQEAATVARDANVGQLIIGHFSQRYTDETILQNEAREIFHNTVLADEKIVFEVR